MPRSAGRAFVVLGVVGAIAVIVLAVRFFHGPDRARYLEQNEQVLGRLPLPLGAHETSRQILRDEKTVFGEQLSHTVGYTTYVTYRVGGSFTSKGIVRFYKGRLLDWRTTSWMVGRTAFACFARKGATVSIQPEGLDPPAATSPKSYGIAVNHKGGDCS
jgi:hypothetical protein